MFNTLSEAINAMPDFLALNSEDESCIEAIADYVQGEINKHDDGEPSCISSPDEYRQAAFYLNRLYFSQVQT